ncbi:hypothetical protein AVEN_114183-1 [Araneus ventricosus]|uniref:Mos1 transposase HTH domain-containing protein n=1 Tax=Araneus ventricosus TaxID=182803 RepID=A0A4Y2VUZ0_ARAVE|nr:hypothetical protein AVEN_114183-1 [Araneus ventricosus]
MSPVVYWLERLPFISKNAVSITCSEELEVLAPSCIKIAQLVNVLTDRWRCGIPSCTRVVNGFASVSSFVESCFRSSLHDGFLQISTNSSYPIFREEGEHASEIYCRMKDVYGEQCLARCTIFRWCQRYETGRVNIKDLTHPGQAHVVKNSATISAVDELIRQNSRITTREIAFELSISKRSVHHRIH